MTNSKPSNPRPVKKMVSIVGVIQEDLAKKVRHHCIDSKQNIQDFVATVVKEYIEKIEEKEETQFPAGMADVASATIPPETPEIALPTPALDTAKAEDIGTGYTAIDTRAVVATQPSNDHDISDVASDLSTKATQGAECKYCGSTATKKKGVREKSQRHFCRSCKRYFTTPISSR